MQRPRSWAVSAALSTALSTAALAAPGTSARVPVRAVARHPVARHAVAAPGRGDTVVLSPAAKARADSGRPAYTAADVRFMSGMIGHHAQAVLMAGWAPDRGASRAVQILCERMVVSQRDEIAFMQRWLRERGAPVPDADAAHGLAHGMAPDTSHAAMPGMDHAAHGGNPAMGMPAMMMPGMLTAEQLARLERARGRDFDRLFLASMIRHHRGAVAMVEELFGVPGAGQDDTVFKFASDVQVDQTTEIDRMDEMLAALPAGDR